MVAERTFDSWEKRLPKSPLIDRDDFILNVCRGRRVVHLGACDTPMAREKAQAGALLHQKLRGVCAELTGYDNDAESIFLLATKFGITDIRLRDLDNPIREPTDTADIVVCADVIEHVNNPGILLDSCNQLLSVNGILLLSTINALSLKQSIRAVMGREPVHPDHVAYHSYATLGRLLLRFGFDMLECRYFAYPATSRLAGLLFAALYRTAPQSADGIIVIARKGLYASTGR
jgi:SAM-dependent methyltransferase